MDDLTVELIRQLPFSALIVILFWRFLSYQAKQNEANNDAIKRRDVADEKSEERRIISEQRHFDMMNRLELADTRRGEEFKIAMMRLAEATDNYAAAQRDAVLAIKALDERTSHQITVSQANQAAIQTLTKAIRDLQDFGSDVSAKWTETFSNVSSQLQEIERLVTIAVENPRQNAARIDALEKTLRKDFSAMCDTIVEAVRQRCVDEKDVPGELPLAS